MYIVFVNPAILHETGMPLAAVTAATCLSAAAGSFLMGGLARYPIALAPGMGLNAYFTYAVVKGMGVPWQAAVFPKAAWASPPRRACSSAGAGAGPVCAAACATTCATVGLPAGKGLRGTSAGGHDTCAPANPARCPGFRPR